jgi:hypothetical protein
VKVVAHQAVGVTQPAIAPNRRLEQADEVLPVAAHHVEYRSLLDPAGTDVVDDIRYLLARLARHQTTVATREPANLGRHAIVTVDGFETDMTGV